MKLIGNTGVKKLLSLLLNRLSVKDISNDFANALSASFGQIISSTTKKQLNIIQFKFGIKFNRNIEIGERIVITGNKYKPSTSNIMMYSNKNILMEFWNDKDGSIAISNFGAAKWGSGETHYFQGIYMSNT